MTRILVVLCLMTRIAAADGSFTATAAGGLNVDTPYAAVELGRRFAGAPHFELYLDYSYNGTISAYPFHTFGVGARTYLVRFGCRFELFHQALAAFALGSGGHLRTLGDRVLGAFLTQGIGIDATIAPQWSIVTTVATGYPVWLRTEVAVRFRF